MRGGEGREGERAGERKRPLLFHFIVFKSILFSLPPVLQDPTATGTDRIHVAGQEELDPFASFLFPDELGLPHFVRFAKNIYNRYNISIGKQAHVFP